MGPHTLPDAGPPPERDGSRPPEAPAAPGPEAPEPGAPRDVELRIHGVAGTPPEAMLRHPVVVRVAGDRRSGFYRRTLPTPDGPDTLDRGLEAYSWSGLTSGGVSRVLWLLLLPFALVNTAVWAHPPAAAQATPPGMRRRAALAAALRLLALTLTGTVVVAVASIGMDLLAWQCGASPSCAERLPASLVSALGTPGQRLAVGALVPAGVLVVLWLLGRQSWQRYEMVAAAGGATDAGSGPRDASLAHPRFWEGDAAVHRLRALHVSSAWALLAALIAYPMQRATAQGTLDGGPTAARAFGVLVVAGGAVYALCAVGVLLPRVAARAATPDHDSPAVRRLLRGLTFGSLALAVVALGGAALPGLTGEVSGRPPGVNEVLEAGFLIQLALVVAAFALTGAVLRTAHRSTSGATTDVPADAPLVRPAARGFAGPVLAAIGWLLAGGLGAGAAVRVAVWLGRDTVALPPFYSWVAVVTVLLLVVTLVDLGVLALGWRRATRAEVAAVRARTGDYAGIDAYDSRVQVVARARTVARLTDRVGDHLLVIVGAALILVVGAAVLYWSAPPARRAAGLAEGWPATWADAGSWLMGIVALGFVSLGYAAYRVPSLRKTVGVIWDLSSFWPRAAHPLAPPCYAERIIPDLTRRIRHLAGASSVVVSAHSQGTVIALATLLQLRPAEAAGQHICLLTYGSPLTRLYSAFFPAFFHPGAYAGAMERLGCGPDRTAWPWRNLYRATDPIGGWVLAPVQDGDDGADAGIDLLFTDPEFARADGDPAWPETRGHSDYWADAEFDRARDRIVDLRLRGRTS